MKDSEIRATLARLVKQVEGISAKVSEMPQIHIQVSSRLLPTLLALQKIDAGTATQISVITQRCRASESKNLNELHMLGIVSKQKKGHERIFKTKASTQHVQGYQKSLSMVLEDKNIQLLTY